MAKEKLETKQFRRMLREIEKDYNKKVEYLKGRREKDYARLLKRVKEESTYKAGTVVKVETIKRIYGSTTVPVSTFAFGIVKEVIPSIAGTIEYVIDIQRENEQKPGFELRCTQSTDGVAYYDLESTDGIFEYTYNIKRKKSQKLPD